MFSRFSDFSRMKTQIKSTLIFLKTLDTNTSLYHLYALCSTNWCSMRVTNVSAIEKRDMRQEGERLRSKFNHFNILSWIFNFFFFLPKLNLSLYSPYCAEAYNEFGVSTAYLREIAPWQHSYLARWWSGGEPFATLRKIWPVWVSNSRHPAHETHAFYRSADEAVQDFLFFLIEFITQMLKNMQAHHSSTINPSNLTS